MRRDPSLAEEVTAKTRVQGSGGRHQRWQLARSTLKHTGTHRHQWQATVRPHKWLRCPSAAGPYLRPTAASCIRAAMLCCAAVQVIDVLTQRKAELLEMNPVAGGKQRMVFVVRPKGCQGKAWGEAKGRW